VIFALAPTLTLRLATNALVRVIDGRQKNLLAMAATTLWHLRSRLLKDSVSSGIPDQNRELPKLGYQPADDRLLFRMVDQSNVVIEPVGLFLTSSGGLFVVSAEEIIV